MIQNVWGDRIKKDNVLTVLKNAEVFTVRTRKLSDAFLIASIVAVSIEIDEITKQETKAHE